MRSQAYFPSLFHIAFVYPSQRAFRPRRQFVIWILAASRPTLREMWKAVVAGTMIALVGLWAAGMYFYFEPHYFLPSFPHQQLTSASDRPPAPLRQERRDDEQQKAPTEIQ